MALTSDDLNFLVYRYLQESGFQHSAFLFGCESLVHRSSINGAEVPPGALITFVQKGIQYLEIEARLDTEDVGDVVYQRPFELLTQQSRAGLRVKKEKRDRHSTAAASSDRDPEPQPMEEDSKPPVDVPDSQVTSLQGHSSEVFICSWCPTNSLLASGSGDSTARIWTILPGACGEAAGMAASRPTVLRHSDEKSKVDVTTLDWSSDGSMLATGSYDGQARIWNDKGDLQLTMSKHKGPIFSLKWNKKGDCLLSGSVDRSAIVWDTKTGEVKQQFEFHKEATLDVDWRNNTTFATCSTDKAIYVCRLGDTRPLKEFLGHQDEINAIKWDPSGTLLASCSDDFTAKVWSMKSDKVQHDFKEHSKEIYTIRWSPTGQGSANPSRPLYLASASFDTDIRIWEIETGRCLFNLTRHTEPVYSVAFSPTGEYLASGSFDKNLYIWSMKDGSLVKTYKGPGGIYEVSWNSTGDKVAACFSTNSVSIIDTRF